MKEWKKFLLLLGGFLLFYFLPINNPVVRNALLEAFHMLRDYAREHVLLCLVPAFFIAGAISNFISQGAVIRFLGDKANKFLAYTVSSVSGSILAVCSCTVLPLFSGIYKRGAGLGPATAFLYSGPAINIMAMILTARVLGWQLGIARIIGAVVFAVVIGLLMHLFFRKEEKERHEEGEFVVPQDENRKRSMWKTSLYFLTMIGILVFLNWSPDKSSGIGIWNTIYGAKFYISGFLLVLLGVMIYFWFKKSELKAWTTSSWDFTKQIIPLLFLGVLVAGFLLGRPPGADGVVHEGIIPSKWVASLVGGNSLLSNFFASISGAFMYLATLTEIPILQSLIGAGMGKGPALALLLAGPALSLPSMLVIRSVLGTKKTIVYVLLVVVMATFSGLLFGSMVA